jgi:hypothetical protein
MRFDYAIPDEEALALGLHLPEFEEAQCSGTQRKRNTTRVGTNILPAL